MARGWWKSGTLLAAVLGGTLVGGCVVEQAWSEPAIMEEVEGGEPETLDQEEVVSAP